ncbi:MAG: hypothetical protein HYV07_12790 [Deltaproteobacteria bacterium]|nr:hypothetical protein [Deltaproteobacteria bacterium]
MFATVESRLDRIESALRKDNPSEPPEASNEPGEAAPPLPDWMAGAVTIDASATAAGLWADEGLVLMSGSPAASEPVAVPETAFAELPYVDDDDFIIIEDPEEFEMQVVDDPDGVVSLPAPPAAPSFAGASPFPGDTLETPALAAPFPSDTDSSRSDSGIWEPHPESYEYKPDFSKWALPESELGDAELSDLAESIPPELEVVAALDSNFGLVESPSMLPRPLLGYQVYGDPSRSEGLLEYVAVDPIDQTGIRLRMIDPDETDDRFAGGVAEELLEREARVASTLASSAFPRLVESGDRESIRFIAYETMVGYPLLQAAAQWSPEEREWCVRRVLRSLAEAMAHLHNRGWVMAELAAEKILLSSELECRVTDISRVQSPSEVPHPMIGQSRIGLAPEVLNGDPPSWGADQFMLGQLAFQLLVGMPPSSDFSSELELEGVSALMQILVRTMLSPDPRDRFASMTEISRFVTEMGPRARAVAVPA